MLLGHNHINMDTMRQYKANSYKYIRHTCQTRVQHGTISW